MLVFSQIRDILSSLFFSKVDNRCRWQNSSVKDPSPLATFSSSSVSKERGVRAGAASSSEGRGCVWLLGPSFHFAASSCSVLREACLNWAKHCRKLKQFSHLMNFYFFQHEFM
jgi:hypothetical protein